jgi:hypothetical protein
MLHDNPHQYVKPVTVAEFADSPYFAWEEGWNAADARRRADGYTMDVLGGIATPSGALYIYGSDDGRTSVEVHQAGQYGVIRIPQFEDGRQRPIADALRVLAKACNQFALDHPPQLDDRGINRDPTAKMVQA